MSVLQNRSLATRAVHAGERRPPVDHVPVATPFVPEAIAIPQTSKLIHLLIFSLLGLMKLHLNQS